MSITRINQFQARDGQGNELHQLISSAKPHVGLVGGLISYQILQGMADPDHIVVVEVWESVAAHQRSAAKIPVHVLEKARTLLVTPPSGAYFQNP